MDDKEKKNIIRVYDTAKSKVEGVILPPPGFISPFKTLQEWLAELCNDKQPEMPVSEYSFKLYYSSMSKSIIAFVGYYFTVEKGVPTRRINFKPAYMFFPLLEREYRKLSFSQLKTKIYNELKEFTETSQFQNSFLAKIHLINTDFAGEIWSKK